MDDEDNGPDLRVVSDQSEEDIRRREAERELEWAKREIRWAVNEFCANLFRVIRGAGRVHDLPMQLVKLHNAIHANAFREQPQEMWWTFENALWEGVPANEARTDDLYWAQHTMVKGALQMVASTFVGQRTQYSRGQSELFDGLMEAEKIRARNWAEVNRPRRRSKPNPWDEVLSEKPKRKAKKLSTADHMRKRSKQLKKK